jgi:hypothetical protein
VITVAEGLVLGAAAAAEGDDLARQLELVPVDILKNHRTLDAVGAVETDLDPDLFGHDSSLQDDA